MRNWWMLVLVVLLGACAPYQRELVCEIKANQSAFLIDVEQKGTNNQARLRSVEFLRKAQVAAQRVVIPQRERTYDRSPGAVEFVPLQLCIKVDRTPETREWVTDEKTESGVVTGTDNKVKKIKVESRESIGFAVGVNITAVVREEDAAAYLYNYPASTPETPSDGSDRIEKLRSSAILLARPLGLTMDTEIRGYVTGELSREFGDRTLYEGQNQKSKIFRIVKANTEKHFKLQGIAITNIALSEGLTYENEQIQNAIDQEFTASTQKRVEEQKRQAQLIKNKTDLARAQGESQVASQLAKNRTAQQAVVDLRIREKLADAELKKADAEMTRAEALKVSADKGQPIVPTVVSDSAGWVYGVGSAPLPVTKPKP
jgi:hypothetical protein